MYTWGYVKDVALAKLDLDQNEANEMKLTNRFPYFANEVITQISSAIKPKRMFFEIEITKDNIGKLITISDPMFISFSDDKSTIQQVDEFNDIYVYECHDSILLYKGYNQVICLQEGVYHIAYNARWYKFDEDTSEEEMLPIPTDILDCIPSYIASQCYKIDDEYKSSVFRNEYEMFLARIDNTDFKDNTTFEVQGDW